MKPIAFLIILATGILLVACSKDTFETTPKIEITDYNTREVVQGQELRVTMNFFDKEGDLNEGILTAIIDRQNLLPLDPMQDKADILTYQLPDFPPKDKGEIIFPITFDFLKESLVENDTLLIHFFVADRENNISDTIVSEQIVVFLP